MIMKHMRYVGPITFKLTVEIIALTYTALDKL